MRITWSRLMMLSIPLALLLWLINRLPALHGSLTRWIFAAALVAIIPLAGRIGAYTDVVEIYLGDRLGGLVSAAFGNIPELAIGVSLLLQARLQGADTSASADTLDILHSLLVGSVINNLLFTLGIAILPAAFYYGRMRFSTSSAEYFIAALGLAAVGLGMPTVATLLTPTAGVPIVALSVSFSLILIVSYLAYLAFSVFGLRDRLADPIADRIAPQGQQPVQPDGQEGLLPRSLESARVSQRAAAERNEAEREARVRRERAALRQAHPGAVRSALVGLGVVSLATAAIAAVLVSVTEDVIRDTPLTPLSVGFILFPIVCNLGEQAGAVTESLQGKVQEALSIAAGSAVQIAFFVTPLLVLASFLLGGFAPTLVLTLLFQPVQLILLVLAVFIFALVTIDGEANWLHGLQMLAFYILIAVVAIALPGR